MFVLHPLAVELTAASNLNMGLFDTVPEHLEILSLSDRYVIMGHNGVELLFSFPI